MAPPNYGRFLQESEDVFREYRERHGHEPGPTDLYHNAWRRLVEGWTHEAILDDIWGRVPPPPPPPPPVPHPRTSAPIMGTLRVEAGAGAFVDDSGPRIPCGCHLGDGLSAYSRDPERVLRDALDPIAEAGYQWVRTWLTLGPKGSRPGDYWHGREVGPWITPDYAQVLANFLGACDARKLRVHLAHGDLTGLDRDERNEAFDIVANVINATGLQPPVLMEGVNEARDTTDRLGPGEIQRLVNRWRNALGHDRLYALSAYTGTEERDILRAWTPDWMPFCYYHGYRGGRLADKARHNFSFVYEDPVRRLAWSGEPPGPGPRVSSTENQHELDDPEAMGVLAASTMLFRHAYTYFCSDGVILDGNISRWAGFRQAPALAARLEAFMPDLHRLSQLTHVAEYKGGERAWRLFDEDPGVRIDQAVGETGAVGLLYGPAGTVRVEALGNHETIVINPETLEETTVGAGFDARYRYGRILLARW